MKNKELKQSMLIDGRYSQLKKLDKASYKETGQGLKGTILSYSLGANFDLIDVLAYKDTYDVSMENIANALGYSKNELKSYLQMDEARKKQASRLYKHINYLFNANYDLIFCTFTFNDVSLSFKEKTRRNTITRLLNDNPFVVDYVGNIDYGSLNEREHYHFIIAVKKGYDYKLKKVKIKNKYQIVIDNMPIDYTLGFATYELIGNDEKDRKKTTKYTAKLGLHALKVKQTQIIAKKDSDYHDYLKKIKH